MDSLNVSAVVDQLVSFPLFMCDFSGNFSRVYMVGELYTLDNVDISAISNFMLLFNDTIKSNTFRTAYSENCEM